MVRNEQSHHTLNDIHRCVEQPGGLAVSGSMETYAEHYNSLNDLNKTNGNEHAMSVQKRKEVRPAHFTWAKAVRPVHSQRPFYASHHDKQAPLRLVRALTLNDIDGCVEQPGRLAVSRSMETYAEHYTSLNDVNKTNGNEHAMSVQKRKEVRPAHFTWAKAVRPVHSQRPFYASHHDKQAPLRLVRAMSRIVSMSAKLAARKRCRNMVDDCLSKDKEQTFAEEQSKEVMASDRFHLAEAVMFECENYLKDHTGFEGFILWALVDSNGCFEQP